MSFMDGKIYYANFSDKNTLNVMNLDGSEDTVLVEKVSMDSKTTLTIMACTR